MVILFNGEKHQVEYQNHNFHLQTHTFTKWNKLRKNCLLWCKHISFYDQQCDFGQRDFFILRPRPRFGYFLALVFLKSKFLLWLFFTAKAPKDSDECVLIASQEQAK